MAMADLSKLLKTLFFTFRFAIVTISAISFTFGEALSSIVSICGTLHRSRLYRSRRLHYLHRTFAPAGLEKGSSLGPKLKYSEGEKGNCVQLRLLNLCQSSTERLSALRAKIVHHVSSINGKHE